ncbi:hypothetical protein X943_003760 [Babesia divergens]|uniref:Uncharacterized protein n=1 Tax=Babesia divergens TaxID=32595 RepID=A0AAD9G7W1_BABDI|nr:hypothetical protein X943_003760 [Babesia divergens]
MEHASAAACGLESSRNSPASLSGLRKFQQDVQSTVQDLYAENDFEGLWSFAERHIETLDKLNGRNYAGLAGEVVRKTIHSVPVKIPRVFGILLDRLPSNDDKLDTTYSGCLRMLVFTKSIALYRWDEYSNSSYLDFLLLSYDLYNALHLAAIDSMCHLCEWDMGIYSLMQLEVILYFLRLDLRKVAEEESAKHEFDDCAELPRDMLDSDVFLNRGIFIQQIPDLKNDNAIVEHILTYCMNELQLEKWSRVVLLWLHDSSLYNVLETLASLPLSVRDDIFRRARSSLFSDGAIKPCASPHDMKHEGPVSEDGDAPNTRMLVSKSRRNGRRLNEVIPYMRLFNYLCLTKSNHLQYALEGCLMIAQLSGDINYELHINLHFLVYMVAQIIITGGTSSNWSSLGIDETCICPVFPDVDSRSKLQALDQTYLILEYARSHHRVNRRLRSLFSDAECVWLKYDAWRCIDLKPLPTFTGLCVYEGHRWHTLEHLLMLEVDRSILNEAGAIHSISFAHRASECCMTNQPPQNVRNTAKPMESIPKCRCKCCIHIDHVIIKGRPFEVRLNTSLACDHVPSIRKHNGILWWTRSASNLRRRNLIDHLDLAAEPMVGLFEVKVILGLIAFCFSVDRNYAPLHVKQSLEFLNYKDTLRKKQRAFIRKILPWVPVVNSEETRKILSFQRMIKTTFNSNLPSAYTHSVEENHATAYAHCQSSLLQNLSTVPLDLDTHTVHKPTTTPPSDHDAQAVQDNTAPHHSNLKTRVRGVANKVKNILCAARSLLYKGCTGFRQFYHDRWSRVIGNKALGGEASPSADKCDDECNPPQPSCKIDCDEKGAEPYISEDDAPSRDDSFRHLDRMLFLVDWLAHYIFTASISQGTVRPQRMPVAVSASLGSSHGNPTLVTDHCDPADNCRDASANVNAATTQMVGVDCDLYAQQYAHGSVKNLSDPLGLLNDIVETAILVSLATFFNEYHYNRLLLRLLILQVLCGRWYLSLTIIKQIKGQASGYKTPFRCEDIGSSNDVSCLSRAEEMFLSHLTAKILTELIHEPQCAIVQISSKYEHISATNVANTSTTECSNAYPRSPPAGAMYDEDDLYSSGHLSCREALILGVSYLKLAKLQIDDGSRSISDYECSMLYLDHPKLQSVKLLECGKINAEEEFIYDCSAIPDNSQQVLETDLIKGADYILQSLSIDPHNFKAWVYLAHCGVRGHDFYFAYNCSKRAIECYDACLSAWLTMAVVLSTRSRSCAPISVSRGVWCEYLVNQKEAQSSEDEILLGKLALTSIPVPFDPVFPLGTATEAGLTCHMNRMVGGDMSKCLDVLVSSTRLLSVFPYAAILQLVARLSDTCVYSFPWEGASSVRGSTNVILNTIVMLLKACTDSIGKPKPPSMAALHLDQDPAKAHVIMRNLVSKAVATNTFLSSAPFIRSIIRMFSCDIIDSDPLFSGVDVDSSYFDGRVYVPCAEEVYGWITCLEILSQSGHARAAQVMFPILETYLNAYVLQDHEFEHVGFSLDVQSSYAYSDIYRAGEAKRHFGDRPAIATDLKTEATFLKLYIRCYVTKDEDLDDLLVDIQQANMQCYSRKLRLLECRVLAGLRMYSECAWQFDRLLKKGFTCDPSTDYLFEYQAMKVYSTVLMELGEFDKASATDAFAEQCYLSTPVLRCELCLVDPL